MVRAAVGAFLVVCLLHVTTAARMPSNTQFVTDVGVLPAELAKEANPTPATLAMLRRPETIHQAQSQAQAMLSALDQNKDSVINNLFFAWARQYEKQYKTLEESTLALKHFAESVDDVISLNLQWVDGSWNALNVLSDLPKRKPGSKRKLLFTTKLRRSARWAGDPLPVFPASTPNSFTWVGTGVLSPVVNQGTSCGSCWANAASSAMDAAVVLYWKSRNVTYPCRKWSRQIVIDCAYYDVGGPLYGCNYGCDGGDSASAIRFMAQYTIPQEVSYPYTSANTGYAGVCNQTMMNLPTAAFGGNWLKSTGVLFYSETDARQGDYYGNPIPLAEDQLMGAVYNQPVVIYWSAGMNWIYYTGGVYSQAQMDANDGCTADRKALEHAMLLVGYNRVNNLWVVQNSWGTSWGEQGFFRVIMTHDTPGPCGLHFYVVAPQINFAKAPPAPNPPKSPPPSPSPPKPKPPLTGR